MEKLDLTKYWLEKGDLMELKAFIDAAVEKGYNQAEIDVEHNADGIYSIQLLASITKKEAPVGEIIADEIIKSFNEMMPRTLPFVGKSLQLFFPRKQYEDIDFCFILGISPPSKEQLDAAEKHETGYIFTQNGAVDYHLYQKLK